MTLSNEFINEYLDTIKEGKGFWNFIKVSPTCAKAEELCREGVIEASLYGKIIRMMWSRDTEMNDLAITIINKYRKDGHI